MSDGIVVNVRPEMVQKLVDALHNESVTYYGVLVTVKRCLIEAESHAYEACPDAWRKIKEALHELDTVVCLEEEDE